MRKKTRLQLSRRRPPTEPSAETYNVVICRSACWPTRCWRRPRRHNSMICWPSQRRPNRCPPPAPLCCSCRASVLSSLEERSRSLNQQSTTCTSWNQTVPFNRHFQAPPKDSSFYDALGCPPPNASVSKDTIGAIQMLFLSYLLSYLHTAQFGSIECSINSSSANSSGIKIQHSLEQRTAATVWHQQ